MIIWGGIDSSRNRLSSGARYNPNINTWTPMTSANAPAGRSGHTAVWTGSEMIVWGGRDADAFFSNGSKYNPSTDTWTAISSTNAPVARFVHTAVWTGTQMIIWGGDDSGINALNTGGIYTGNT